MPFVVAVVVCSENENKQEENFYKEKGKKFFSSSFLYLCLFTLQKQQLD